MPSSSPTAIRLQPVVIDLDGTLTKSDLLHESANRFLIDHPLRFWQLGAWLAQGKATLKSRLAEHGAIGATSLRYNEEVLAWIRGRKASGHPIVLATASHRVLAEQVAAHLGLFDEVIATDHATNLKGGAKRQALVERFGEGGFEYMGNEAADLEVWRSASRVHVVSDSARVHELATSVGKEGVAMRHGAPSMAASLARAMRPHQWLKNLLVFVPLLAAHRYGDGVAVMQAMFAFAAFSLAASSVYLLNDLIDVEDDRHHVRKRGRPFAAGHLSLAAGWMAWPLLLAISMTIAAALLSWKFAGVLGIYVVSSAVYSLKLKQVPMVDVVMLAALYTLRIIGGAVAISVPVSFWLLAFSMFLFLSLAFVKRYSELWAAREANVMTALRGRGYQPRDLEMIASLGSSSGLVAVLVLALYIQDSHTASLYAQPRLIWLACPLLLYWIARAWLIAHRGQMHDDPIVFALKDRASWMVIALLAVVFVLAKVVA